MSAARPIWKRSTTASATLCLRGIMPIADGLTIGHADGLTWTGRFERGPQKSWRIGKAWPDLFRPPTSLISARF